MLLVVAAPAGSAPVAGHRYSLVADYTFSGTPGGTDFGSSQSGTLGCIELCADVPPRRASRCSLRPPLARSPGPVSAEGGAGSVSIAWSDSTSSAGSLNARARDRKVIVLDGTVDSGRFAGYKVAGSVSTPGDSCQPAGVTGELNFLPAARPAAARIPPPAICGRSGAGCRPIGPSFQDKDLSRGNLRTEPGWCVVGP